MTVHREGPLTLKVGSGELTLTAWEVDEIVEGANKWAWHQAAQAAKAGRRRPPDPQASSDMSIGVLRLIETLLRAPSRITDPPVELDQQQTRILSKVLLDMAGYQRVSLSAAVRRLSEDL